MRYYAMRRKMRSDDHAKLPFARAGEGGHAKHKRARAFTVRSNIDGHILFLGLFLM